MTSSDNLCEIVKPDGSRCRARPIAGTTRCVFHTDSPEAREARIRGGRSRSNLQRAVRRMPPDLRSVYERMAQALDAVLDGSLEAPRATAAATIARSMVMLLEATETLERLAAIEAALVRDNRPYYAPPQRHKA